MTRTGMILLFLLLLLIGGGLWLYFWDIPAPSETIEQELSDDGIRR